MKKSTTNLTPRFTSCASLAALGIKIRKLDVLAPIRKRVLIPQKTVKDTPFEKLCDAFISILAGGTGLVEVNMRVRADQA